MVVLTMMRITIKSHIGIGIGIGKKYEGEN